MKIVEIEVPNMYFQIQDIENDCLIIAYGNEKYYEYEEILALINKNLELLK